MIYSSHVELPCRQSCFYRYNRIHDWQFGWPIRAHVASQLFYKSDRNMKMMFSIFFVENNPKKLEWIYLNSTLPYEFELRSSGSSSAEMNKIRWRWAHSCWNLSLIFLEKRQNRRKLAKPWLLSPMPWKEKIKWWILILQIFLLN